MAVRRSTKRQKTRPAAVRSVEATKGRAWFTDGLAIISAALAFFLFASFISIKTYWSQVSDPQGIKNLMGPVGHIVGTMTNGLFGWCAMVPVLGFALLGLYFWGYHKAERSWSISHKFLFLLGLAGVLVSCCVIGGVFGGRELGGEIGATVAKPLVKFTGQMGGYLLAVALLLLSLAFATQQNLDGVVRGIFSCSLKLLKFLVATPLLLVSFLAGIFSVFYFLFAKLFSLIGVGQLLGRETTVDEIILPKPKRRTNQEITEEQTDEEVEEVVHDSAARVVVQRRAGDHKTAERNLKRAKKRLEEQRSKEEPEQQYVAPDLNLLSHGEPAVGTDDDQTLRQISSMIELKLKDFGVLGRVTHVHPGPVITLFEFEPAPGIKVGRIAALQDDLSMSLRASSIRIIAPIPNRGTVGIEIPNKNREIVRLRDVLESEMMAAAESVLSIPLGKDTYGDPVVADLALMPHLLMAGTTGTGKSVSINALLISLLYRATPAELGLILIDPKILELSVYDGIPHLRVPVVTVPRQAKAVLEWAVNEMNRRYRMMQRFGVRGIDGFNRMVAGEEDPNAGKSTIAAVNVIPLAEENVIETGTVEPQIVDPEKIADAVFTEKVQPLPKIVIVIDELADLMLSVGRDIEDLVTRLAQKARAAGIHLIVATQRPSVDVVTGLIKANFPARLSFRVSSRIDSRTILDTGGAEKLLGRGDMLFMAPGSAHLKRVHGAFVSDAEVKRVVEALTKNTKPRYDQQIIEICEKALEEESADKAGSLSDQVEYDNFYDQAVELVTQKGQASTSMLQRAFRIGYNRAARIIDVMEQEGIIGPMDGAKPREILAQSQELQDLEQSSK